MGRTKLTNRISGEFETETRSEVWIGDGITSFGEYEGTDLGVLLTDALEALPTTGGTIYVQTGSYTLDINLAISKNNVTIVGVGNPTITQDDGYITVSGNDFKMTGLDIDIGGVASTTTEYGKGAHIVLSGNVQRVEGNKFSGTIYDVYRPFASDFIVKMPFAGTPATTVNDLSGNGKHADVYDNFGAADDAPISTAAPMSTLNDRTPKSAWAGNGINYLTWADPTTLGLSIAAPFSIEFWAYGIPNSVGTTRIFFQGASTQVRCDITRPDATSTLWSLGGETLNSTAGAYDASAWKHHVYTYDGTGNRSGMQIYIDGVLDTAGVPTPLTALDVPTVSGAFVHALGAGSFATFMNSANVAMLHIYNRELSAGEVAFIYTGTSPTFKYLFVDGGTNVVYDGNVEV